MPFDRNFAVYQQQRTLIPVLAGRVDGYPREEHQLSSDVTRYPVESGATLNDNVVKQPDRLRLEGWVSDILPAPGNVASPDRAADVWGEIYELIRNRTLVMVITGLRVYRDMVFKRIVAPVDKLTGRSLRFTVDLEQIQFSDTAISRFPPAVVDASGPAADRTSEVDGGHVASPPVAFP